MSWLTEQIGLLRDFLRTDFRRVALLCALGLLGAAVLGFAAAAMAPEMVENIWQTMVAQLETEVLDEEGNISVFALLTNNWMAMLVVTLYGFVPFLFLPLLALCSNGALIGMLAETYHVSGLSPLAFAAGILPHGIFELPALVLSIACGVYLCRNMCWIVTRSPNRVPQVELLSDLLRVLLLIVLPLTLAAAVIECYVTPAIMEMFL